MKKKDFLRKLGALPMSEDFEKGDEIITVDGVSGLFLESFESNEGLKVKVLLDNETDVKILKAEKIKRAGLP